MIRKSYDIPVVGAKDRYMTTSMTAYALGITPQAVNKAITGGRLDATEFVGRYFILVSEVKKFAKATGRKFRNDRDEGRP